MGKPLNILNHGIWLSVASLFLQISIMFIFVPLFFANFGSAKLNSSVQGCLAVLEPWLLEAMVEREAIGRHDAMVCRHRVHCWGGSSMENMTGTSMKILSFDPSNDHEKHKKQGPEVRTPTFTTKFSDSADSHQVDAIFIHSLYHIICHMVPGWDGIFLPGFCGRIVRSKEEGKFEATFKTSWKKRDFGVKTMEVAKRKVAKYRYFIELLYGVISCIQLLSVLHPSHFWFLYLFPSFSSWFLVSFVWGFFCARWPASSPIWGTTKRRLPSCLWSDGRRRKSTRDGRDGLITGVKLWSKIHPNFNHFLIWVY